MFSSVIYPVPAGFCAQKLVLIGVAAGLGFLPLIADRADIEKGRQVSQLRPRPYRMTSSAWASKPGGIVTPSDFAIV